MGRPEDRAGQAFEGSIGNGASLAVLTLDDAGNVGIKIINGRGEVEFVVADIALSTSEGVWLTGLPETATIITVGQGCVASGASVNAVPESEVETAVAIAGDNESDGDAD